MIETPPACRLIIIAPAEQIDEMMLGDVLQAGDVASVVLWAGDLDESDYIRLVKPLVAVAQAHNVAALVVDDSVAMGRSGADGIVFEQPGNDWRELVARFSPHKIVGFAGNFTRHRAMELGEGEPDFLLFGRLNGDSRPVPHPKNLSLAHWWSQMVEIPCAVLAGSSLESLAECAQSGSEFVAAGRAVFENRQGAAAAVQIANQLLRDHASTSSIG